MRGGGRRRHLASQSAERPAGWLAAPLGRRHWGSVDRAANGSWRLVLLGRVIDKLAIKRHVSRLTPPDWPALGRQPASGRTLVAEPKPAPEGRPNRHAGNAQFSSPFPLSLCLFARSAGQRVGFNSLPATSRTRRHHARPRWTLAPAPATCPLFINLKVARSRSMASCPAPRPPASLNARFLNHLPRNLAPNLARPNPMGPLHSGAKPADGPRGAGFGSSKLLA